MHEENDSLKAKIAKLARLAANDGATEAEALNALTKAQDLCMQHNIELASISLEENHDTLSYYIEDEKISIGTGRWRRTLANEIAIAYGGCCVWTKKIKGSHSGELHVFCPEGTYSSIQTMYEFIEKWVSETVEWEFMMSGTDVHGKTWKNSWIIGAVDRIVDRIHEQTELSRLSAEERGKSKALAKITEDTEKARDEAYPEVTTIYHKNYINPDAYGAGKAAGSKADLGNAKIGVGGQKALSS